MTTSPEPPHRPDWPKRALVLAALAGLAAAVVAWGRAAPEPDLVGLPDATDPETNSDVVITETVTQVVPAPETHAPTWVRHTIIWTIGAILTVVVALWLLGVLSQVVGYLVLALFFSFALEPAVNRLHARGWKRGSATGLILGVVFLMMAGIVLIFVPTVLQGALAISEQVPEWSAQASEWSSDTLGVDISTDSISESASDSVDDLTGADPIEALLGFTTSFVGAIFAAFTVGMFIFYMVAEGPRFKRAVLSFFPPVRQEELVSIWEAAIEKTGGYFYSKLLLMLINGGLGFLVLRLTDVPGAAALGFFQGFVAAFIPIVGTYIAAVVPLVAAFMSQGGEAALIYLIYVLIYQQIENYLISPKLQGRAMQLHPAVAFGAALAGGAIGGLLWAFLALPFAATVQASASLWFQRHEVKDTPLTHEQVTIVKKERRSRSLGTSLGDWVRSSKGWLRDHDEPADEPLDETTSVGTASVEAAPERPDDLPV